MTSRNCVQFLAALAAVITLALPSSHAQQCAAPTLTPNAFNASSGSSLIFDCSVSPLPSAYLWQVNGVTVASQTEFRWYVQQPVTGGSYRCGYTETGCSGTVWSNNASVITPPVITLSSVNVMVSSGGSVELNCSSVGYPSPSVTWYFNNTVIGSMFQLVLASVTLNDAGNYTCLSTNSAGYSLGSVQVTVLAVQMSSEVLPSSTMSSYVATTSSTTSSIGMQSLSSSFRVESSSSSFAESSSELSSSGFFPMQTSTTSIVAVGTTSTAQTTPTPSSASSAFSSVVMETTPGGSDTTTSDVVGGVVTAFFLVSLLLIFVLLTVVLAYWCKVARKNRIIRRQRKDDKQKLLTAEEGDEAGFNKSTIPTSASYINEGFKEEENESDDSSLSETNVTIEKRQTNEQLADHYVVKLEKNQRKEEPTPPPIEAIPSPIEAIPLPIEAIPPPIEVVVAEVSPATDEVSPATDEVSSASDEASEEVSPTTDEFFSVIDEVSPASDEVSHASDKVSHASDEVSPATDEVSPATDKVSPATDEVSPATDEVSPASDEVSPATDEVSPATDAVFSASDKISPATDEVSPASDRFHQSGDEIPPVSNEVSHTDDEAPITDDEVSSVAGSIEVTPIDDNTGRDIEQKPLALQELEKLVNDFKSFSLEDRVEECSLSIEYKSIPMDMPPMSIWPPETHSKNRYRNVIPNKETAVVLSAVNEENDESSTYINANYIDGYKGLKNAYICAQAPIYETIPDFWRMIWEHNVSTVVMLCGIFEGGKNKCAKYWPPADVNNTETYGMYVVCNNHEEALSSYKVTYLSVYPKNEGESMERDITLFTFPDWPDFGAPDNSRPILELQEAVEMNHDSGPLLVHCSAGLGRSGVFIAMDIGIQQYNEEGIVDPYGWTQRMRQQRGGMIQSLEQYVFLHTALAAYIAKNTRL